MRDGDSLEFVGDGHEMEPLSWRAGLDNREQRFMLNFKKLPITMNKRNYYDLLFSQFTGFKCSRKVYP